MSQDMDAEDTASSSGEEESGSVDLSISSPIKQSQSLKIWASVTNPQFIQKGPLGGHVEYQITFGFSATNQRSIWKRFSDFHTLYKTLSKNYKRIKHFKNFPKKSMKHGSGGSSNQDSFNQERCSKLDEFMKVVVSIEPIPPELSEWIRLSVANPIANNARMATTINEKRTNSGSSITSPTSSFDAATTGTTGTGTGNGSLGMKGRTHETSSELSPHAALVLEAAAREAQLKLIQDSEESQLKQEDVRQRQLTLNNDSGHGGDDEFMDMDNIPPKARSRLGSFNLSPFGNSNEKDVRNDYVEPSFNMSQLEAKVEAAVKVAQVKHKDAMKVVELDVTRLNDEVSTLLDEKEELLKSKKDILQKHDVLQHQYEKDQLLLTSLALRTQYQIALSRLKIRIAGWERDGRDQHIRYLVEVRSDLPGLSQPRPPPGPPPPPATVPICGPGPISRASEAQHTTRHGGGGGGGGMPPRSLSSGNTSHLLNRNSTANQNGGGLISRRSVGNTTDSLLHPNGGGGGPFHSGAGNDIGPGINTLVRHRYTAFVELKQCLGVDFPLPTKTYFRLNRKELQERATQLEAFLQEMVNKFNIERIPILLSFLGIPPYGEDIIETSYNMLEIGGPGLVDHFPNIDALLESVVGVQVQLQSIIQQKQYQASSSSPPHQHENSTNHNGGGAGGMNANGNDKGNDKGNGASSPGLPDMIDSTTNQNQNQNQNNNSLHHQKSSESVQIESDSDEERDDSVAVL